MVGGSNPPFWRGGVHTMLWLHAIIQCMAAYWHLQLGVHMGHCKPPLWSPGAMSLEPLAILPIPHFQIIFPCINLWPNLSLFYVYFCLRKTCMVTSSPHHHTLNGNTKWLVMWTYHNFFSKHHVHAFSCQPKHCLSQIN